MNTDDAKRAKKLEKSAQRFLDKHFLQCGSMAPRAGDHSFIDNDSSVIGFAAALARGWITLTQNHNGLYIQLTTAGAEERNHPGTVTLTCPECGTGTAVDRESEPAAVACSQCQWPLDVQMVTEQSKMQAARTPDGHGWRCRSGTAPALDANNRQSGD